MKLKIILAVAAALLWGFVPAFAETAQQEPEKIELTTYYPAPYGEYDELSSETIYSNRIAIGNNMDLPGAGRIAVENSVIYKPRAGDPTSDWGEGTAGELAYSSSKNEFYYNSGGTNWAAIGEDSAGVLYLSCPWGSDHAAGANKGWGNQCGADGLLCCTPVSCPTDWTSVATYPEPVSVCASGYTSCYWGDTGTNYHPVVVGRTVRVCVKQ